MICFRSGLITLMEILIIVLFFKRYNILMNQSISYSTILQNQSGLISKCISCRPISKDFFNKKYVPVTSFTSSFAHNHVSFKAEKTSIPHGPQPANNIFEFTVPGSEGVMFEVPYPALGSLVANSVANMASNSLLS